MNAEKDDPRRAADYDRLSKKISDIIDRRTKIKDSIKRTDSIIKTLDGNNVFNVTIARNGSGHYLLSDFLIEEFKVSLKAELKSLEGELHEINQKIKALTTFWEI